MLRCEHADCKNFEYHTLPVGTNFDAVSFSNRFTCHSGAGCARCPAKVGPPLVSLVFPHSITSDHLSNCTSWPSKSGAMEITAATSPDVGKRKFSCIRRPLTAGAVYLQQVVSPPAWFPATVRQGLVYKGSGTLGKGPGRPKGRPKGTGKNQLAARAGLVDSTYFKSGAAVKGSIKNEDRVVEALIGRRIRGKKVPHHQHRRATRRPLSRVWVWSHYLTEWTTNPASCCFSPPVCFFWCYAAK